jgi:hypothetical protein
MVHAVKINFDVAVRSSYMVVVAVFSDHVRDIFSVFTKKVLVLDISGGEASAALSCMQLIKRQLLSPASSNILLEGDSLSVITAINNSNICVPIGPLLRSYFG